MPELPDVEIFRQYARARALRQRIAHTSMTSPEILKGTTPPGTS